MIAKRFSGRINMITQSTQSSEKECDLHVIFPPQWTPYQPFLSTPSLKAYLERCGFSIHQSDWNVEFHQYFISKYRLRLAKHRLRQYISNLYPDYESYRARCIHALAILEDYERYRDLASRLHEENTLDDLRLMSNAVNAFYRLLDAFSVAEPVVEVGSSSFSAARVLANLNALDAVSENRQDNPFIEFFEEKLSSF